MNKINPKVDVYLAEGCGRCPLGGTPECKVHTWSLALDQLRMIILDCGLTEELKWGVPCYMYQKSNILLLAAFKDYCAIMFMKGALLKDTEKILIQQTEHVQATRQIRFTDAKDVMAMEAVVKAYIYEAIEIEKAGLKVNYKEKSELQFPEEFQTKLDENPALKAAFQALTPGRQRGYNLYFSAPKQSKTRAARVENCIPKILDGKGIDD